MVRSVVDVEVFDEFASQTVFGEHAFNYMDVEGVHTGLEVLVERFLHQNLGGGLALSAGVAGVGVVDAVGHLLAGEYALVGIDDDNIVAALHEGRVRGLVLAAQDFGNFRAEAAQNLVGGVNHHPFALHALSVG